MLPGTEEESFTMILDREWQENAGLIAFIGPPTGVLEGYSYKIKILSPTLNGEFDTIFFNTVEEMEDYEKKLNGNIRPSSSN